MEIVKTRIEGGNNSCRVVPVFVSHSSSRSNEVLTYTQSSILLISTSVAEKLHVTGEETELFLSTISAEK